MSNDVNILKAENEQLKKDLQALKRRNIDLEKDAQRLDWLADTKTTLGSVLLPKEVVFMNLESMRGAIDMAMRMQTQEDAKKEGVEK